MTRTLVLLSVVFVGGSTSWLFGAQAPAAAPAPQAFDPNNFVGLVTQHGTTDIRMNRYTFSPGARSNWHSHAEGQVLYAEKGSMRTQEQGKPLQEVPEGTALRVPRQVVHWHGALPGTPLTQVSLSFGPTTWMQKVTDAEYGSRR